SHTQWRNLPATVELHPSGSLRLVARVARESALKEGFVAAHARVGDDLILQRFAQTVGDILLELSTRLFDQLRRCRWIRSVDALYLRHKCAGAIGARIGDDRALSGGEDLRRKTARRNLRGSLPVDCLRGDADGEAVSARRLRKCLAAL